MTEAEARRALHYLVVMRMGGSNFLNHVRPILEAGDVRLTIVRPEPPPAALADERVTYVDTAGSSRFMRVARTVFQAIRAAREPSIRGVLSFNAVPYGVIAVLAARLAGKPCHVGFVGTDAHLLGSRWWGRLVDPLLRSARYFTVPGKGHQRVLSERGYEAAAVSVLPHSIDVDRFRPPTASEREWDLLFVGRLAPSKHVDHILSALARVSVDPAPRLVVVGEGPEQARLVALAQELDVGDTVRFEGFQDDTSEYFRGADVLVMASSWEGLPFALIEAMCSGTIPIVTSVGAIPELVHDRHNGILVEANDINGLAAAITEVLGNPALRSRLRDGAMATRNSHSYATASRHWQAALRALETS